MKTLAQVHQTRYGGWAWSADDFEVKNQKWRSQLSSLSRFNLVSDLQVVNASVKVRQPWLEIPVDDHYWLWGPYVTGQGHGDKALFKAYVLRKNLLFMLRARA